MYEWSESLCVYVRECEYQFTVIACHRVLIWSIDVTEQYSVKVQLGI